MEFENEATLQKMLFPAVSRPDEYIRADREIFCLQFFAKEKISNIIFHYMYFLTTTKKK